MNIILLGAPGSGKGTQASRLVEKNCFTHINPGTIFREELALGTELGWKVSNALKLGELVTDDVVSEAVFKNIGTRVNNFLFDGYPRTIEQVRHLDASPVRVDIIIYLEAPLADLKERLLHRGRADDLNDVIEERFRWFEAYTLAVVNHYKAHDGFVKLDATQPVDEVAVQIQEAIRKIA